MMQWFTIQYEWMQCGTASLCRQLSVETTTTDTQVADLRGRGYDCVTGTFDPEVTAKITGSKTVCGELVSQVCAVLRCAVHQTSMDYRSP